MRLFFVILDCTKLLIRCRTWIVTFDSLGATHQTAIKALQAYLKAEALDKKSVDLGNKLPVRGRKVPVCRIPFLRHSFNSRSPLTDPGTTKLLRLWRLCWTSGRNYIQVSCQVLAARLCKLRFLRQYWTAINGPQPRSQKVRLTENHPLWDVERFKEKRNELYNLITRLSEQWKEGRSKTALTPLPNSSTPEAAAKGDKETSLFTPNKRKARSGEPMEVSDEDDEVIILDPPAAKRQQRTPRRKTSTPRKSTGSATRPRR